MQLKDAFYFHKHRDTSFACSAFTLAFQNPFNIEGDTQLSRRKIKSTFPLCNLYKVEGVMKS